MQDTRYSRLFNKISNSFFGFLRSSWKLKSLNILSLLMGYFFVTNLITNFIPQITNKLIIVPIIIFIFEIIIRIKPSVESKNYLLWSSLDKFRIGGIYALVLEAFKLGS